MNVGIYIYDNAEVLDFSGPFEVFSTAARVSGKLDLLQVYLIGETGSTVTARAGFKVIPLIFHLPRSLFCQVTIMQTLYQI